MLPDLQSRYDAQQREVEAVIVTISASAPEALIRVAAPGEWSALHIVGHLMLSSETVGAPTDGTKPGKPLGGVFNRLVIAALNLNARLPVPDKRIDPETALASDVTLDEVLRRWQSSREQLRAFLESVTPETLERRPFLHSVIGPLTSAQLLELGAAHTAYHRRQLDRLVTTL